VPPLKGTPLALLKQVAVLAQQTSLSSSELEAVLQTRYVAPDAQSLIELRINTSAGEPPALNSLRVASLATYLDRIEQFVALQRALAVPTPELDLLIETLGAATNLANLFRRYLKFLTTCAGELERGLHIGKRYNDVSRGLVVKPRDKHAMPVGGDHMAGRAQMHAFQIVARFFRAGTKQRGLKQVGRYQHGRSPS
jgi:hypothetical protein